MVNSETKEIGETIEALYVDIHHRLTSVETLNGRMRAMLEIWGERQIRRMNLYKNKRVRMKGSDLAGVVNLVKADIDDDGKPFVRCVVRWRYHREFVDVNGELLE